MAMSLNKVLIIGNVGRDPEMRYLPNGTPVTSFSVAAWPHGGRRTVRRARRPSGSTSSPGTSWLRPATS